MRTEGACDVMMRRIKIVFASILSIALLVQTLPVANAESSFVPAPEVSYVLEPFEVIGGDWHLLGGGDTNDDYDGRGLNLTIITSAPYSSRAEPSPSPGDADADSNESVTTSTDGGQRLLNSETGAGILSTIEAEDDDDHPRPLFGQGALRLEYDVALPPTPPTRRRIASSNDGDNDSAAVGFGWISGDGRAHNCRGATHLSLWYRVMNSSAPFRIRLVLLDDSDCIEQQELGGGWNDTINCSEAGSLENYYSIHRVLGGNDDDDDVGDVGKWREFRVELLQDDDRNNDSDPSRPFLLAGHSGPGNGRLDLDRIRGWRIELLAADDDNDSSVSSLTSTNSTTTNEVSGATTSSSLRGVLLIDQLSCVGGGEMLGAAFRLSGGGGRIEDNGTMETSTTPTFEEAVRRGAWAERYHKSPRSRNQTSVSFLSPRSDEIDGGGFGRGDTSAAPLRLNYTLEQSESWGGFLDVEHIAPGAGYYNLSMASAISLAYRVGEKSSSPGRAHVRIILLDSSDCHPGAGAGGDGETNNNCDAYPGRNLENYYSFHYILDAVEEEGGAVDEEANSAVIASLEGSNEASSPFWLTGWEGTLGDGVLDSSFIKGFRIELNVDSQGGVGSTVSGSITFDDFTAIVEHVVVGAAAADQTISNTSSNGEVVVEVAAADEPSPQCVGEPDILFVETSHVFRRVEFLGSKCCEVCMSDPDCLYAHSNGLDCFLASHLDVGAVGGLVTTQFARGKFAAYWKDDAGKRGDFCEVCDCIEEEQTIDCRGKDLAIAPKTFSPQALLPQGPKSNAANNASSWTPLVLDLRDNPRLVVLGTGALNDVGRTLQELRLPRNLVYFSLACIQDIPALDIVRFEGDEEEDHDDNFKGEGSTRGDVEEPSRTQTMTSHLNPDQHSESTQIASNPSSKPTSSQPQRNTKNVLMNVIMDRSSDFFGDVCCGLGKHATNISIPESGLTFCDLHLSDVPGADAIYEPFIQYVDASPIKVLTPSSGFMSEAAESPEKCAEYCHITDGCRFFSYDARWKGSEHTCHLWENAGSRSDKVCCDQDDYADVDGTLPGWTSGRPPTTRNKEDGASVLVGPKDLVAEEANGYTTEFTLSLGSTPLRGAVWIEPTLVDVSSTTLNVSVSPKRIALYDNATTATVRLILSNVASLTSGETLVIDNAVRSCDAAYTAVPAEPVAVRVVVPPPDTSHSILLSAILVPLAAVLSAVVAFVYVERRKKHADSIWRVKPSELSFDEPPEIIGRGTFGLVLLAEYRGTQVAVKRVIPPRAGRRSDMRTKLFGWGDRNGSGGCGLSVPIGAMKKKQVDGQFRRKSSSAVHDSFTSEDVDGLDAFDAGFDEPENDPDADPEADIESGMKSERRSLGVKSGTYHAHKGSVGLRSSNGKRSRLKADFIAEMRHLSKLRHPCITTVMGAVISKREEPMLVMEYMDHGSLYDLLHNSTMVIEGELLLPILRDIARGVRFLHAASPRVIHGDLKAQNVLVDSKFRAKVADFGLSQKKQVGATGTPFWMAPELLRGEKENHPASDVYSFGIILYEVYSRRDPYEGEEYQEVLRLVADPVVNKRPPMPASCPSSVQSLMADCLLGDPEKRPTFEELDHRLKRLDVETVEPGDMHLSMQAKKEQHSQRTDELLFDVFPRHIAEALRDGRKVEPESRDAVTIFFSDIVSFTNISSTLPPIKISNMLDRLYNRFDDLSHKHDVFKVETIGDAYMAVTNLVKDQPDHTKRIAEFAIDTVRAANETLIDLDDPDRGCVHIRVGFHSGPVVANVVGSRNPRYCLFGDTVNTASRMESNSKENRIHCSERAATLLRRQRSTLRIRSRGRIQVKGKGHMRTYWVDNEPYSASRRGSKMSSNLSAASFASIASIGTATSANTGTNEEKQHPKLKLMTKPKFKFSRRASM